MNRICKIVQTARLLWTNNFSHRKSFCGILSTVSCNVDTMLGCEICKMPEITWLRCMCWRKDLGIRKSIVKRTTRFESKTAFQLDVNKCGILWDFCGTFECTRTWNFARTEHDLKCHSAKLICRVVTSCAKSTTHQFYKRLNYSFAF